MTESLSVTLTRTFQAPIDLVYRAWADQDEVGRWMKCEPGVEVVYDGWQPRVGAVFTNTMRKPGEWEVANQGRFLAVDPPRLLVYCHDANEQMHMPEMTVRVELEEVADGTKLTLTHTGLPNDDMCGIVEGGWTGGLQQLADRLALMA